MAYTFESVEKHLALQYLPSYRRSPIGNGIATILVLLFLYLVRTRYYHGLHKKQSPLVRIGLNYISASIPLSSIYKILQLRFEGSDLYYSTQNAVYAALKRTVGTLYTTTAVSGLKFHLDNCTRLFLSKMSGILVNFLKMLGVLESGTDVDGISHLDHEQMMYLLLFTGARKENPLFNFALNLILARQKNTTDMLNFFLDLFKSVPEKFTLGDIIVAAYINVVTAHDVVAITLRAVVYYLAKNLSAQKRLYKVISEAAKSRNLFNPADYSEIASLRYISTPKGGVTLDGNYIPKNTIISGIFGEDAHSFRPERWIESDPRDMAKMRTNMFTFGAGARNFIGKNLAIMPLTIIIIELYRNFEISLINPEKD
ncbi:cytochrome P450 [Xylaria castorea]|nr:cytochrome P450 [Xylaria castorea]